MLGQHFFIFRFTNPPLKFLNFQKKNKIVRNLPDSKFVSGLRFSISELVLPVCNEYGAKKQSVDDVLV